MQSGSLARFLPAVALVGIGIFSIAASFADGDEVPTFSKAGFHARLAKYIQRTNEACGSQLQLTSDFETITQDDWAQPHEKPSRTMGHIANICSDVFEAVRLLCQNGGDDGPKLKAAIASQLKTIRCQFSDVLPSSASENRGLWMKRNMSFEKGTFTIRIAPGTYPPSEQATEVLRKVLSRAGGPTVPLSALAERGESCELASECGTNYCSKGVCASCSKTNKCPKKLQCYNDGCFTAAEVKEAQDGVILVELELELQRGRGFQGRARRARRDGCLARAHVRQACRLSVRRLQNGKQNARPLPVESGASRKRWATRAELARDAAAAELARNPQAPPRTRVDDRIFARSGIRRSSVAIRLGSAALSQKRHRA